MSELDLYKFITEYGIEWHFHNDEIGICLHWAQLDAWYRLTGDCSLYDDGGLTIIMRYNYLWISDMKMICDYFGINHENIFEPEKEI